MSTNSPDDRASGAPSNAELSERLARVEEKQDYVAERVDEIGDTLDGELATVEDNLATVEERNARLWILYQGGKWITVTVSGSSMLALLVGSLL